MASGLLVERVTAIPPPGAGPASINVPTAEVPPTTVAGESDRLAGGGANMVSAVDL
jgi:hypothetical protein